MLAVNVNVWVIPICHNSGVHWKNRSLRKQTGKILVVIGPPISGSDPKEITNQACLDKENIRKDKLNI
jgi:1-acyl-sn-glycerol-3-phosphate acyltransferase